MNLTYVKGLESSIMMKEFEVYVLNVIPEGSDCFKLCFSGHKNNYKDSKDFSIIYVDEYGLEDIIKDFRECIVINKGLRGNVYTCYHGDKYLLSLYSAIMEIVECETFHMESEWG